MEQNKLDITQLIGFLFLIAAFIWLFMFQPEIEEFDQVDTTTSQEISPSEESDLANGSSFNSNQIKRDNVNEFIELENDDIKLVFSTQGAQIKEAVLKNYSGLDEEVFKIIDEYNIVENSSGQEINLFYEHNNGEVLFFKYILPRKGFLLKLDVQSQGYSSLLNRSSDIDLNWTLSSLKNSKSQDYENRYTYLNYQDKDQDVRDLSAYSDDDDIDSAKWISYGQHFFNSILIFDDIKDEIQFSSKNLDSDSDNRKYLKKFESMIPIYSNSKGEIEENFEWYIGPNDYYIIKDYDYKISDSIWFGWGIFGWINKSIFFPLYEFLSNHFSAGIAIIIMVILTRLAMSPVQYKMYLSQAKMKILKPEIAAASEKYKDDPMKKQQETMKIYSQAGASPVQGCLPALLQLPVFYALFCFFPVAFALRGESFLWADDLSTYDVIADLPFYIPLYGDHISLFPILAGATMFIYTKMQGTNQMQPSQPGMPNMKFIMYIIPFTLLIFFNNFAAGLSLYYTVSNILTVLIMLAIKNVILDEEKILQEIEENKKKPAKEGRFQRRLRKLQEAAEQAQKQQNQRKK